MVMNNFAFSNPTKGWILNKEKLLEFDTGAIIGDTNQSSGWFTGNSAEGPQAVHNLKTQTKTKPRQRQNKLYSRLFLHQHYSCHQSHGHDNAWVGEERDKGVLSSTKKEQWDWTDQPLWFDRLPHNHSNKRLATSVLLNFISPSRCARGKVH